MPRRTIRSSSIPTLSLTPDEVHKVEDVATALLNQTLQIESEFFANDGEVDEQHWKQLKSQGNFSIFKERNLEDKAATTAGTRPDTIDCDDIVFSSKRAQVPMIVATGEVDGSVDDAVFGFAGGDIPAWRTRTIYIGDQFTDAKIVATIHKPTVEEPLNYFCIKWFVHEFPVILNAFVNPRDFLQAEAAGVKVDEQGERFGYYMLHEFEHPTIAKLDPYGVFRGSISLVFIMRQVGPGRIHIFSRGYVDPRGDLSTSYTALLTAKGMCTVPQTVNASYYKKMVWLMAQQDREHNDKDPRDRASSMELSQADACAACAKSPGFLKSKFEACRLCQERFCSRCIIEQSLVLDVSGTEAIKRTLPFCLACILKAKQTPPRAVAVDAVKQAHGCKESTFSHYTVSDASTGDLYTLSVRSFNSDEMSERSGW
ncbi:hypothetical protein Poli38472_012599 [Pythium oligandrum]|uniref:FYVE-type domain-containing protein n=1 Tax=Pythium oligandrum TaxID=41045 RepID=A0A8K1FK57_PYTOL|nr:hypothetical protein Poli38472_012599 [Pythium oligandrum]|eukprot:TMW61408.1 hypothetical protein Poli38472_012599 [Pythium oligandrum]